MNKNMRKYDLLIIIAVLALFIYGIVVANSSIVLISFGITIGVVLSKMVLLKDLKKLSEMGENQLGIYNSAKNLLIYTIFFVTSALIDVKFFLALAVALLVYRHIFLFVYQKTLERG